MTRDRVTFSFGKNWNDYNKTVSPERIQSAVQDIKSWLGEDFVRNKRVIDVGCGSGVHSLAFYQLGASELRSFDSDIHSVNSTKDHWNKAKQPVNWIVDEGSVLDGDYIAGLGVYDILYSWGVLHHTGDMWNAIDRACALVKPGGVFWIGIYAKGPKYKEHLALKRKFNSSTFATKQIMIWKAIFRKMISRLKNKQNPFGWNQKKERGMNTYHDIVDWLGGLPYEVASEDEMISFFEQRSFRLLRSMNKSEGSVSVYLFERNK